MSLGAAKAALFGASGAGAGTGYRYLRVVFDVENWISGALSLNEVEHITSGGITYPLADMTADNVPAPLVASGTTLNSSHYKAYDGSTADWALNVGTGLYTEIDLGSEVFVPTGGKTRVNVSIDPSNTAAAKAVLASNTGVFAGEEVTLFSGNVSLAGTSNAWVDIVY